ncbi:hypothetical protein ACNOYE_31355 [Nannocystaceae bacterium ST9]
MTSTRPTLWIAPLLVCLFVPTSHAAPEGRATTGTKPASKKPPRKTVVVSKQVQERLAQPTTKKKPLRYEPITRQEVRKAVPSQQRPARQQGSGAPKRVTNTELTNDLNAIEKRINAYGYSLRQGGKTVYREHKPNRERLAKQIAKVDEVAGEKPARAPLSESKLRERVRQEAKRERPARAPVNQAWGGWGPVEASWDWRPILGESDYASAFLDTRARFEASLSGSNPGLHGSVTASAGGHFLGERVDVLTVQGSFDAGLDGTNRAKLVATLLYGEEMVLVDETSQTRLSKNREFDLPSWGAWMEVPIGMVGFPIMLEIAVEPKLSVRTDLYVESSILYGVVAPDVEVGVTASAYIDMFLAEAGVGGELILIDAQPQLMGYSALDFNDRPIAEIHGWIDAKFLFGRIFAFLELGFWPFEVTFETDLANYSGTTRSFPIFATSVEL